MAKVTADSTEASAGRCGSPLRGASHAASSERRSAAGLALCHGTPPTERLKDRPVLLEVEFCAMDDRPQRKCSISLMEVSASVRLPRRRNSSPRWNASLCSLVEFIAPKRTRTYLFTKSWALSESSLMNLFDV